MIKARVLVFKNRNTNLVTYLYSGFKDKNFGENPCYQFKSKEIPITGIFTGYPLNIMIEWMNKSGYELVGNYPLQDGSVAFNAATKKLM